MFEWVARVDEHVVAARPQNTQQVSGKVRRAHRREDYRVARLVASGLQRRRNLPGLPEEGRVVHPMPRASSVAALGSATGIVAGNLSEKGRYGLSAHVSDPAKIA